MLIVSFGKEGSQPIDFTSARFPQVGFLGQLSSGNLTQISPNFLKH